MGEIKVFLIVILIEIEVAVKSHSRSSSSPSGRLKALLALPPFLLGYQRLAPLSSQPEHIFYSPDLLSHYYSLSGSHPDLPYTMSNPGCLAKTKSIF
jgi:hypothetical protein